MIEPTQELIMEWNSTFEEYKTLLQPNRKSITEVIEFIRMKYPMNEDTSERARQIVVDNIIMNKPYAMKIPKEKELRPIVFTIPNEEKAKKLYSKQKSIYVNYPIKIGMELETGIVFVEGSDELADEIVAYQGLDMDDLNNFYSVANYVRCLKKYGILEDILNTDNDKS